MTVRNYREHVTCPKCGERIITETPLCAWIREHPMLDSQNVGIVRFDLDILVHRYMFLSDDKGVRDIQAMMFIEAKTNGAELDPSQHDTLRVLDQVFRNRKPNMHKRKVKVQLPHMDKAWSQLNGWVDLRLFGGHLLQIEGQTPNDGKMRWGWPGEEKEISSDQFVALLRFELDPDTLKPFDIRRRSGAFGRQRWLFQMPPKFNGSQYRRRSAL